MTVVKTKEFFNNGKTGSNNLFDLRFFEGEEGGRTLDDFTKKFLPLVGEEFEVLTKRLRYQEKKLTGLADYQLEKMYGGKIIKTPNRIAQEMHAIMTKPLNRGGKKFRDGKSNSWYYLNGKCVYVVRCKWSRRQAWVCTSSLIYLGGPYGEEPIRMFTNCYLSY